jgi:hypothetical protein
VDAVAERETRILGSVQAQVVGGRETIVVAVGREQHD